MPQANTTKESGTAGKPGESTAAQGRQAAGETRTLTPEGITSLLSEGLQELPAPETPEEVRGAEGDESNAERGTRNAEDQEQAEGTEQAEGEESEADQEQEQATEETGSREEDEGGEGESQLPEHLEAELKQWEEQGGKLPPSLQTMFDKRVRNAMKERDDAKAEADAARAEAETARAELEEARASGKAPANPTSGFTAEGLDQTVRLAKRLVADVRAFAGDYATDEQKTRLDKYAKAQGLDDAGLRRNADEWSEWLRDEVPQLRQRVTEFKTAETEVTKIVTGRFGSLSKKDAPEAAWAKEVQQLVPELAQRTPAHKLAIGVYALGRLAWDHLSQASDKGDVIEALRGLLAKHAPLPTKDANGKIVPPKPATKVPGALPGKAPVKPPTAGSPPRRSVVPAKDQQQQALSAKLKEAPTAENATALLASALR